MGLLVAFVLGVLGGGTIRNLDGVAEPDNWLHLVWGPAPCCRSAQAHAW